VQKISDTVIKQKNTLIFTPKARDKKRVMNITLGKHFNRKLLPYWRNKMGAAVGQTVDVKFTTSNAFNGSAHFVTPVGQ
jgi:hypothetical protein